MARTTINSLGVPAGTIVASDLSYPLTTFSSTGIDDNADATAITIDSNENVGIGTPSPDQTLHVHKGSAGSASSHSASVLTLENSTTGILQFLTPNSNVQQIRFGDPDDNGAGIIQYDHSANILQFNVNGIERMQIGDTGNTGIGVGETTAIRLNVKTAEANHVATQIENSNTADSFGLIVKAGNDANDYTADFRKRDNSNILRIRGDGKIGLGTTSPAALLHINGSGDAIRVTSTNSGVGGAQIDLLHFTASPADGDDHASINFGGYYSGSTSSYGSAIRSNWTDVSGRESNLKFFVRNGGTFYNHMQLNHFGHLLVGREDNSNHSSRVKIVNGGGSGYESSLDFCYESKDTVRAQINTDASGGVIHFRTFDSDGLQNRMRIQANGTLLIGKSSEDNSSVGCRFNTTGDVSFVANGNRALVVVRKSSDGEMALFLKDSTTVGKITSRSSQFAIGCNGTGLEFNDSNDAIIPFSPNANNTRDNALDLGMSSVRFNQAYIYNGVTSGSDEREKQEIAELNEAETRVAVACKGLLRKWRWKDAVEAKDNNPDSDEVARIHFGIIAQNLKAAFEAEGLDAGRYGMFIHDTWTDEETGEKRDRMGIRYSELLAFIIAAI